MNTDRDTNVYGQKPIIYDDYYNNGNGINNTVAGYNNKNKKNYNRRRKLSN